MVRASDSYPEGHEFKSHSWDQYVVMVELADTLGSEPNALEHVGSNPTNRTLYMHM